MAVKLTTGFDRLDAPAVATARRVIAFLQDFVANKVKPLDAKTVRARLARPLKVPQEYLPKASVPAPPRRPLVRTGSGGAGATASAENRPRLRALTAR